MRLTRPIALGTGLLGLALATVAYLAIDRAPAVAEPRGLSRQEVDRVERLLRENDPRTLRGPVYRTLTLTAEDLNALTGYLLVQHLPGAASRVSLGPGEAQVQVTLRLPANPLGDYLNLVATFGTRGVGLVPRALRVGRVPVPEPLARFGWSWLERRLDRDPAWRAARESIRDLRIGPSAVRVRYEARPELADAARDHLVPALDQARLAFYQGRLGEVLAHPDTGPGRAHPVAPLIQVLARSWSAAPEDPAAENRALLVVLAAHAVGRDLRLLSPQAPARASGRRTQVLLRGRVDLAQHFLVSAALSAAGGGAWADAVGLSKELADAHGGSGFSFTDLAADRAGRRFGESATASPESARAWRGRVGAALAESDIMPGVEDLPEFLSEEELRARFGGVGSPAYRALIEEIDRRVSALPFHR